MFEYPIRSNIENYPNELIDALVVQQGYADEFDSHPEDEEDDRLVFHNRMSSDDDFEALCEIIQQPDYPQEGYTVDNQLTKIVNTKKHKQRVDTERCRWGNALLHLLVVLQNGYVSIIFFSFSETRIVLVWI